MWYPCFPYPDLAHCDLQSGCLKTPKRLLFRLRSTWIGCDAICPRFCSIQAGDMLSNCLNCATFKSFQVVFFVALLDGLVAGGGADGTVF